jgi:hypothetical protein
MSGHLRRLVDSSGPRRPVRVHVDRVVVFGMAMSAAQSRLFGAALARELTRLAREPGWSADLRSAAVPCAIAPAIARTVDATAATLGCEVARSLHRAVGRVR